MPYTQVSDVKGLIPYVPINAQSQPNEGDVATWIGDVERALNVILKNLGFEVPVTGPDAVKVLRDNVAHAIAARVLRSRPNPESDPENFQRRYDAFVKALGDSRDNFDLPDDAVRVEAVVVKDSGRILRTSARAISDLDDEPRVSRDQVF